ncbi:MAG: hypothetical protein KC443_20825, partial [Anaerolineales bacterium]|nr:hypothetical protein [Anaerolineales bacterium]
SGRSQPANNDTITTSKHVQQVTWRIILIAAHFNASWGNPKIYSWISGFCIRKDEVRISRAVGSTKNAR